MATSVTAATNLPSNATDLNRIFIEKAKFIASKIQLTAYSIKQ